jgi:hypothetical protein
MALEQDVKHGIAQTLYRMMLGDFEITALLDGTHPFPAVPVVN